MTTALPRLLLLAALFAPLAARAQITVTSSLNSGTSAQAINIGHDDCVANINVDFAYNLGGAPAAGSAISFIIAHAASDCSVAPVVAAGDVQVGSPSQTATTGAYNSTPGALELNGGAPDGGGLVDGCNDTTHTSSSPYTTNFCVQVKTTPLLGGTPTVTYGSIPINFSMRPPTQPTGVAAESGDSHAKVSWAAGNSSETILKYQVFVVPTGATVDLTKESGDTSGLSIDATQTDDGVGLANDTSYDVYVRAQDVFKNYSAVAKGAPVTPKAVDDFYNHYRNSGGSAVGGGGCSTGGAAGWIAALALLAALWARRRNPELAGKLGGKASGKFSGKFSGKAPRGFLGGLFALAALTAAPAARAQSQYDAPPRRLLLGFKLDRYDPKIDSEKDLNGATPYLDVFGTRKPLRFQIEGDWEIAHPFGSFLLGLTAGYWQNIGKGIQHDTGAPASDTALLDVLPFGLVATYRLDYFTDHVRWFPLVPYAQAGLSAALWSSFSGTGKVSRRPGDGNGRGSAWTYGYTTALGVALALDALDPSLSREAYNDTYIQRTSIFAEYGWTRLDDFRHKHPLILSDRGWRFGLSLEF